jgi:hypothetical protein
MEQVKQTAVSLIFEKFNLLSDFDFKSWMLNNYDELFEMEKEQLEKLKDFDTWKEWKNTVE